MFGNVKCLDFWIRFEAIVQISKTIVLDNIDFIY